MQQPPEHSSTGAGPSAPGIDRRRFLGVLAAGAGAIAVPPLAPPALEAREHELLELTAREAVAAMRAGELKATRYAAELVARARSLASLNAIRRLDAEQVLTAARAAAKRRARGGRPGPLHGLPVLIKDNINTALAPTTAGTPALAANRPRRNALVVDRLLAAGAIVLAKSNLHELAVGITSNNAAFGPVRNPYDPTTIPGGSSGGNGAALAARIAPAALGTDTAGSVRIPASLCGIAGLRPSVGRYPSTGDLATDIVPISPTRDTPGPMARTVADVALLDAVITGEHTRLRPRDLRGVRLGVDRRNFFADLDPQTETVVAAALRTLQDRAAHLVELEIPDLQALNAAAGLLTIGAFEAGRALPHYLAANDTGVSLQQLIAAIASPDARALFALVAGPDAIPEPAYRDALAQRPRLQAAYHDTFTDALVLPTTPLPARPIGHDSPSSSTAARSPRSSPTSATPTPAPTPVCPASDSRRA